MPGNAMPDNCHFSPDTPGLRVWISGNHAEGKRIANRHFRHAARPLVGPIDGAVIAAQSTDEAVYFAAKVQGRLVGHGKLWIIQEDSSVDGETGSGAGNELESRLAAHGYRRLETPTPCHGLVCIAFTRSAWFGGG